MQRIKNLPWAEIIVVAAVIAIGASVYAWTHRGDGDLEESKRRGTAIAQALESYRVRNGAYPEQLEELVPDYIDRIEQPAWGAARWHYRRHGGAGSTDGAAESAPNAGGFFELSVAAPGGYPVLYHDAATRSMILHN